MTDEKPVFKAAYSDFKIIRTRKCAQIILEICLEEAQRFVSFFGLPNPAAETWFGIAGLETKEVKKAENEKRHLSALPLPQQAALLGDREDFWRFLRKKGYSVHSSDAAADAVRDYCHVNSRHELLENEEAAQLFRELAMEFSHFIV